MLLNRTQRGLLGELRVGSRGKKGLPLQYFDSFPHKIRAAKDLLWLAIVYWDDGILLIDEQAAKAAA